MAIKIKDRLRAQGKALPYHAAFADRDTPTSVYAPGAPNNTKGSLITQNEAPRHADVLGGVQALDWVSDCIGLYTDTASAAEWHFERDGKRLYNRKHADNPKGAELVDQRLVDLFEKPNPFMDYAELLELLIMDLLLVGNGYWLKYRQTADGKPLALYRLAPGYVQIEQGDFGPKSYVYQPPGVKDKLIIPPEQVAHFKLPNPHSVYYGLGMIKRGGRPLDLELALADTTASYYENKADPSLIVESERRIPRDVFRKLKAQLRARSAGPSNAGELLLLESGLKAKSLTPSARDAAFAELSRMSRDRLLAMFRVSPLLLGILDEAAGGIKPQDARREFDNHVLRPMLLKLARRITAAVCDPWGVDFKIDHRYIMAEEDLVKLGGDFAVIPGVRVRDIRRFVLVPLGLPESTGDPTIDDMVLNLPGENGTKDNPRNGFPDQPLPGEPGRPPNPENTKPFPAKGAPLPADARVQRPSGKALTDGIIARLNDIQALEGKAAVTLEPQARTTVGTKLPDEERPQDSTEAARDRDITAISSAMRVRLDDAAISLERALLDHAEGKASMGSLIDRIRSSAAWTTFRKALIEIIGGSAFQAVSTAAVHQAEGGLRPDTTLDYEAIAKDVIHRAGGVNDIPDTLKADIIGKVGAAIADDNATRADADRAIQSSIDAWRATQSETVALTEVVHAYNEGVLTVGEAAGVTEFVVSDGHDHDEPCKEADGSVWDVATARANRLEHPRCRRAFVPLVA